MLELGSGCAASGGGGSKGGAGLSPCRHVWHSLPNGVAADAKNADRCAPGPRPNLPPHPTPPHSPPPPTPAGHPRGAPSVLHHASLPRTGGYRGAQAHPWGLLQARMAAGQLYRVPEQLAAGRFCPSSVGPRPPACLVPAYGAPGAAPQPPAAAAWHSPPACAHPPARPPHLQV